MMCVDFFNPRHTSLPLLATVRLSCLFRPTPGMWYFSRIVFVTFFVVCVFSALNGPKSFLNSVRGQSTGNDIVPLSFNMNHLKTGTTIVGICCKDGIALGADTRSTGGPLVMDKNKLKIHTISNNIMACAAGTSADCDQMTRKAGHYLQLIKIEKELATDDEPCDSLVTAVTCISDGIRTFNAKAMGRKAQSVMLVGGVDFDGPGLFQIDTEGVPTRVSFGALGSGCTDALAVLEHARQSWVRSANSPSTSLPPYAENVGVEEAVAAVRRAVQAGILNDLGSGSHVDLCVITAKGTRRWRETQVSTWEKDRLAVPPRPEATPFADTDNAESVPSRNEVPRTSASEPLGRRVLNRVPMRRRLTSAGTVVEDGGPSAVNGDLSLDIEFIE